MHYITAASHIPLANSPLGAIPGLPDVQKMIGDALKDVVSMYATTNTPTQVFNIVRFNNPNIEPKEIEERVKKNNFIAPWKNIRNTLIGVYKFGSGGSFDPKAFADFEFGVFKTAYISACKALKITPLPEGALGPSFVEEDKFPWVPVIAGVGVLGLVAVLLLTSKKA